jgi:hypothetical protein
VRGEEELRRSRGFRKNAKRKGGSGMQVYFMSIYTCTIKPKPVNPGDGAMRFTPPYIYKGK